MSGTAASSAVNLIPVRMGEMAVSRDKRDVLSVVGLGSCVAVVLVAPEKRTVALAHVVLPEARMTGGREAPPGKFADTAIPAMLYAMRSLRVKPEDVYGVLVGGATMFGHTHSSKLAGVGDRNIEAARHQLAAHGIGIASEDVGGISGRSVHASVADLEVFVRSAAGEPVKLKGSAKPLAVKVSPSEADLSSEPFPDDIWNSGPVPNTPTP
ncbi:MAG: chemotaxis protein CheD [Thermoleophilaceae bacterium]|nr:chemotaxis protein CheD [Thermoleophilaceae bacterium]